MKRCLLIGVAIVIVFSGVLVGCTCGQDGESSSSEVLQIPDGPRIDVVVNFPKELSMEWDKLTTDEIHLIFKGAVTNVSDQMVSGDKISFLLDGKEIGRWPQRGNFTLGPREKMAFYIGNVVNPDVLMNSKRIEVIAEGYEVAGGSLTPTEATKPEEETVTESTMSQLDLTPEEVAVKFYYLINEGKNNEAERLLSLGGKDFSNGYLRWTPKTGQVVKSGFCSLK